MNHFNTKKAKDITSSSFLVKDKMQFKNFLKNELKLIQ